MIEPGMRFTRRFVGSLGPVQLVLLPVTETHYRLIRGLLGM
jgi:hypothetical protein